MSENAQTLLGLGVFLSCTFATSAQFPAQLDADEFDGRNGFTVTGEVLGEFGNSVAGVGDFATGGRGFFSWEFCNEDSTAGAVYVIFGGADIGGNGLWSAGELDATNGFRIPGIEVGDECGFVSAAGDFNDDGVADFLVGARSVSPFGILVAGDAYLIYGGSQTGAQGEFDLTSLDGSNGFTIHGMFPLGGLGSKMASIGDLNDDGVSDVALGNVAASPAGRVHAGQVYVLYGGRGTGEDGELRVPNDMTADIGLIFNGISAGDSAARVGRGGDINGDGVDDLIISSRVADTGPDAHGQVYVIYGGEQIGPGPIFELADLDGTNGFMINGPPLAFTGEDIAGVGDVNGDGFDDVGVSVDTGGDWVGIVFGGPNVAPDGVFCLEDLNGENGFRVIRGNGNATSSDVAFAGDLNRDGIDDMFLKVFASNFVFGAESIGASGEVDVMQADGQNGVMLLLGRRQRGYAGDLNADGIADAIVGDEYEYDWECDTDVGAVHIVFGRRMGDGDLDADVDFADFGGFQRCFRSELSDPEEDPDVPDVCHPFDFDKDNDVDPDDYAAFQAAFGTPP